MSSSESDAPSTPADSFDRTGILVLLILCLAMFISGMNAIGLQPFLVDIGGDLDVSVSAAGQAMTVTLLMSALAGLIAGPVADHFGHRRLMVGVARRRALSITVSAMSGTAILGVPLLSWIGDVWSWRWAFASLGVIAILLTPLLQRLIPLTLEQTSPFQLSQIASAYRPLLRQRAVVALYIGSFLRAIFWLGILTYFGAFLIEKHSLSLQQVGFTYMAGGAGFLLGSLAAGGRVGQVNHRVLFTGATLLSGLFFGLTYVAPVGAVAAVLLLTIGGFFGAIGWVILNTMLATESQAGSGTTMSLNNAIFNLGSAAGGAVGGGLLAVGDYSTLGYGLPVFAIAASILVWRSRRVNPDDGRRPE